MNQILPLFGRNSNLINQSPVTSVDKLVCIFDKCTSYIPRLFVCVCVCACVRACVRARAQHVLNMYKV